VLPELNSVTAARTRRWQGGCALVPRKYEVQYQVKTALRECRYI